MKCDRCKQVLPSSDFSAAMRRTTHGKMTCWACQHPKCTGDGCEARQTVARVGNYTCEKCLYPPCHICKTTPRPKGGGSTYKCHIMPAWVCPGCKTNCRKEHKTNCRKCGRACPEKKPEGRKREQGIGLCDACLFPHVRLAGIQDPKTNQEFSFGRSNVDVSRARSKAAALFECRKSCAQLFSLHR